MKRYIKAWTTPAIPLSRRSQEILDDYVSTGEFNDNQLNQIFWGLKFNDSCFPDDRIDISQYADPKFTAEQMSAILKDLKLGVWRKEGIIKEEHESYTFSDILKKLKQAGIDTTKYKYEMRAQEYERYTDGDMYTIKFTCSGDYLAYIAMAVHKPLTPEVISDFFDDRIDSLDEIFEKFPDSLEEMSDYASSGWWGDGDDYIIYLKNLTTGEYLYEA